MDATVEPVGRVEGELVVPGDKSVSHRGLILAAMASGTSTIRGSAPGLDVASTASCLRRLGVEVEPAGPSGAAGPGAAGAGAAGAGAAGVADVAVRGTGWEAPPEATLDAGNSATTMRLLAGALAGRRGSFRFVGDESLSRRPMDRVADPLRSMGAVVELSEGRYAPMRVTGASLTGITYRLPVASAQVKGAILLAGLQARGATVVLEEQTSRDHTERMLAWLGVPVDVAPGRVTLDTPGRLSLPAFELDVPGDFSSAAFWIVAGCLLAGSDLRLAGVGLNPSRTGLLEVLASMGAAIEVEEVAGGPEPAGSIRVRSSHLAAVEVGGDLVVRTIDELPLVALSATQAEGTTVIRDAAELRLKESDRLSALAEGLQALGASVEERPDGLIIEGPTPLHGGEVDPKGDHRLALTFAVAGMVAAGPVAISGWECAAVSYPGFEEDLAKLAR